MTRTKAILFLVFLCFILLLIHAASLFTLTVVYRLQLIEQDLDFMIRQQDVHLENQGEIKDKADQLLDIFAGATSEAPFVDEFTVTAYTLECGNGDGLTATMTRPETNHTIAVDPQVVPLGSRVYLPGRGMYRAEDTGGAIQGNRLDIFMGAGSDARREAMQFGRQNLKGVIW